MPHEYTRQRQGRDFVMHKTQNTAQTVDSANIRTTKLIADYQSAEEEAKKSLTQRLERFKEEAERNAIPIDGIEPSEKRGLQK